jgi:hypothetical protein
MSDEEIIARIRQQNSDLPPPAPPEAVAELEGVVGHPMSVLLKRIYLEVADGGFGRWGEALSLTVPYEFSDSRTLVKEYLEWIEAGPERGYVHPPSVVPLLTWGCAIWSLVDYSTPEGRMWGWDPNGRSLQHALFPEDRTLTERLTGWLDGNDEDFPQAPPPTC